MTDVGFFGDPADRRFQVFRTQEWPDGSTTDVALVCATDVEGAALSAWETTLVQCQDHNRTFPFLNHSARVQRNFE